MYLVRQKYNLIEKTHFLRVLTRELRLQPVGFSQNQYFSSLRSDLTDLTSEFTLFDLLLFR